MAEVQGVLDAPVFEGPLARTPPGQQQVDGAAGGDEVVRGVGQPQGAGVPLLGAGPAEAVTGGDDLRLLLADAAADRAAAGQAGVITEAAELGRSKP